MLSIFSKKFNRGARYKSPLIWLICNFFEFPFYVFLVSIYVPVWLASNNFDLFQLSDTYRALLVSFLLAIIGFLIFGLIYASVHKAAFVIAFGFLCLYGFAPVRQIFSILGVRAPGDTSLIVLLLVFFLVGIIAYRLSFPAGNASRILNGFAIALLILPIGTLSKNEFRDLGKRQNAFINPINGRSEVRARPSVVHIVLDGYSRADTLKELYNFNNAEFLDSLRKLGFTVADRATSAYNQTILSMSSVFSMGYMNEKLQSLSRSEKSDKNIRVKLHWDFQGAPVLKNFRTMGYKIIEVENLYWGVQFEKPDVIISNNQLKFGLSYFETILIQYTPIYKLINLSGIVDQKYEKVKFSLAIQDMGFSDHPYFVYNHVMAPHPPFNISADGGMRVSNSGFGEGENRSKKNRSEYEDYRDGYLAKLRYANRQILEKAKYLIAAIPDPKVIIIHGDHGGGLYYDQGSISRTCLKERFSTLLAVYFSADMPPLEMDADTNIVNLYRLIFTQAFGLDFELLPSRHFYSTWGDPGNLTSLPAQALTIFSPVCAVDGIR